MNVKKERPVLNFKQAAVCLHFVEIGSPPDPNHAHTYPDSLEFRSMELDMLSYRFQTEKHRPFGSQCERERLPIEIVFPDKFTYFPEGRDETLECRQPLRAAELVVSSSRFFQSGIHVWHVVITPRKDHTFSEFDIIKLIHLYDGRAEHSELNQKVRFRAEGLGEVGVPGLLRKLCNQAEQDDDKLKFTAGSIEITLDPQTPESNLHDKLLHTVRNARKAEGSEEYKQLQQWMDGRTVEGQMLMAYCGIVTGIFDFNEMDEEEVLDTLEPTFSESSGFLLINRCTLTCITKESRAMEEFWSTVGISPYLIIPHAVLLHNEALVDAADHAMQEARSTNSPSLSALVKGHEEADHDLNHLYLPNVFNYVTERSLYEKGGYGRGSDGKQSATLAKLGELHNQIETKRNQTEMEWNKRQRRAQRFIALLLVPLLLSELHKVLSELGQGVLWPGWDWGIAIFVAVVLVILMFLFDLTGAKG